MDVGGRFLAARNLEIAAARRAAADEDRVIALGQERLQAVDALAQPELDTHVGDVADLFVDHRFGQAEFRDLAADHAARLLVAVEDDAVITQGHQVAGDGERCRAGADEGNALAVLRRRNLRQQRADVVLVVGGDAFQAANRHRLLLDPRAAAGRLARPVAGPPEDPREDVRFPIDHIGVGVPARGDQPDILRHRGMGGAGPLAIDDFMKVFRRPNVGGLQITSPSWRAGMVATRLKAHSSNAISASLSRSSAILFNSFMSSGTAVISDSSRQRRAKSLIRCDRVSSAALTIWAPMGRSPALPRLDRRSCPTFSISAAAAGAVA